MPLSKAINAEMMDLPHTGKLASYPLKGPTAPCVDRFKLHSLPKDAQAKREGQFTSTVDFMPTKPSFGGTKSAGESSKMASAPAFSVGDPAGPGPDRDRFKVDSLPKETVKKLHGLFSQKVDFIDHKSNFGPDNPYSQNKNLPAYSFGGGSPAKPRDRYKYDSLDKDVMAKMYGNCTPATIDFASQQSSFGKNRVLSADHSLPAYSIGSGGGPAQDASRDRFKYDSLPKETIKKYFGNETKHLGFVNAPSF
jgi:hypothetical protein